MLLWQWAVPAPAALKLLAWRDRRHDDTRDAVDLGVLLMSASNVPYVDQAWEDTEALEATEFDIVVAGAYRLGRRAGDLFDRVDGEGVLEVLDDPGMAQRLVRDIRLRQAGDLVPAFRRGFRAALETSHI